MNRGPGGNRGPRVFVLVLVLVLVRPVPSRPVPSGLAGWLAGWLCCIHRSVLEKKKKKKKKKKKREKERKGEERRGKERKGKEKKKKKCTSEGYLSSRLRNVVYRQAGIHGVFFLFCSVLSWSGREKKGRGKKGRGKKGRETIICSATMCRCAAAN